MAEEERLLRIVDSWGFWPSGASPIGDLSSRTLWDNALHSGHPAHSPALAPATCGPPAGPETAAPFSMPAGSPFSPRIWKTGAVHQPCPEQQRPCSRHDERAAPQRQRGLAAADAPLARAFVRLAHGGRQQHALRSRAAATCSGAASGAGGNSHCTGHPQLVLHHGLCLRGLRIRLLGPQAQPQICRALTWRRCGRGAGKQQQWCSSSV